jgi:Gpi18-like mannosyltransferase
VSWLGGLLAVWAIFAVGNDLYGRSLGIALSALWGMAPASLTLTMGYPEGLFTAAAAAALLCLMRRRPVWAGACALVAGLLRPVRRGGDHDGRSVFPGGVRTPARLAAITS